MRIVLLHFVYDPGDHGDHYRIATHFILEFDGESAIPEHHFRKMDALTYAKEGVLEEKLDKVFGE